MMNPNQTKEQMENRNGRYNEKMMEPLVDLEEDYDDEEEMAFAGSSIKDEEISPGLFQSDVDSWKKQFDGVYHANIKGKDFVYRMLERFEYKTIISMPNTDPLIREEMICEYCVLFPQDYNFADMSSGPAGIPAVLSEAIMDTSGFTRDVVVRKL